jgi:hypothetical protein
MAPWPGPGPSTRGSDSDGDPAEKDELPWRERKERYLSHLDDDADPDRLLVSVSDKLHHARALVDAFRARGLEPYVDAWDHVVRSLEDAAGVVASDTAVG